MKGKIRCFIAINIPEDSANEILKIQHKLKNNIWIGKFVEKKNLHLTLKFLGELSEENTDRVKRRLSKINEKKFQAQLGKIGFFSPSFIRIIWIEILGVNELQKKIDDALKNIFIEEKRFMPHLTIARVKNMKDGALFLNNLKNLPINPKKFEISEFYLVKSNLTEKGAEYEILDKFFLK